MRYLKLARKLSRYSSAKHQKMAAVVVRGGAILSAAVNLGFKHAEHRAISQCSNPAGATIYVARKNGRISRPCDECQQRIINAGIRSAVYVSLDGTTVKETYQ